MYIVCIVNDLIPQEFTTVKIKVFIRMIHVLRIILRTYYIIIISTVSSLTNNDEAISQQNNTIYTCILL